MHRCTGRAGFDQGRRRGQRSERRQASDVQSFLSGASRLAVPSLYCLACQPRPTRYRGSGVVQPAHCLPAPTCDHQSRVARVVVPGGGLVRGHQGAVDQWAFVGIRACVSRSRSSPGPRARSRTTCGRSPFLIRQPYPGKPAHQPRWSSGWGCGFPVSTRVEDVPGSASARRAPGVKVWIGPGTRPSERLSARGSIRPRRIGRSAPLPSSLSSSGPNSGTS